MIEKTRERHEMFLAGSKGRQPERQAGKQTGKQAGRQGANHGFLPAPFTFSCIFLCASV